VIGAYHFFCLSLACSRKKKLPSLLSAVFLTFFIFLSALIVSMSVSVFLSAAMIMAMSVALFLAVAVAVVVCGYVQRLAEEKRQWLEMEAKRMEEEKEEHLPLLQRRAKQLIVEQGRREEKGEWENFISCTHLPDFGQDSELSTFITLWEETPDKDLEQVLQHEYILMHL